MNVIYEAVTRSWRRRWGVSFVLAVGIAVAVVVAAGAIYIWRQVAIDLGDLPGLSSIERARS